MAKFYPVKIVYLEVNLFTFSILQRDTVSHHLFSRRTSRCALTSSVSGQRVYRPSILPPYADRQHCSARAHIQVLRRFPPPTCLCRHGILEALPFVSLHRCTYRTDFLSLSTCITDTSLHIQKKARALAKLNLANFYTTCVLVKNFCCENYVIVTTNLIGLHLCML